MTDNGNGTAATRSSAQDRSAGELVKDLSEQTSRLIRQELELARVELTEKGRHAGMGAGMFGGAGVLAWFGFGALTAAAILGLATTLDAWLAALIVGGAYLLIAGVMALAGKRQVRQAGSPAPEQALESSRRDVEAARRHFKEGRAS